eukprot:scaffold1915_cov144-Amphora_coffeaeformis.AAC.5
MSAEPPFQQNMRHPSTTSAAIAIATSTHSNNDYFYLKGWKRPHTWFATAAKKKINVLGLMFLGLFSIVIALSVMTIQLYHKATSNNDIMMLGRNNHHHHPPSQMLHSLYFQNATSHGGGGGGGGGGGSEGNLRGTTTTTTTTNQNNNGLAMQQQQDETTMAQLRQRLPPSIWTTAGRTASTPVAARVLSLLNATEHVRAQQLCGKFLYSTLQRATQVGDMGESTFVATGDIDDMWTRDSAVQVGIYMGRMMASSPSSSASNSSSSLPPTPGQPWLRLIVQGAIRRQAFNIIQDPYANAYERRWIDPSKLELRDRVIGRGGWVATRNYELDSGAYFLTQLYDYYVTDGLYRPESLLQETIIFDAVELTVDVWIVEQHHEEASPYRYFELPREGKGAPSGYTGMSWTGFRPSDDPCQYGYLIPANIHAAAGLERVIEMNKRVWKSTKLHNKATKLLHEMEQGIQKYGIVPDDAGNMVYAYEVDGLGGVLSKFDDANVPSLLSIPLLGWSKYDREIYRNTRKNLLSPKTNKYYFEGETLRGIGSPHTPHGYVWPMAFAVEALTEEGSTEEIAESMVFQIRQSLKSACNDAMHEGVEVRRGCEGSGRGFTRVWFEWANALFVVLLETATGQRCDGAGRAWALAAAANSALPAGSKGGSFYQNKYKNDPKGAQYYQGVEALVPHYE